MDISYRWLRAVAPGLGEDLDGLDRTLADRGAPVEGVKRLGRGLEHIVVGRVAAVEPHPDADRLTVCRVDAGGNDPVPVVCGAPNVTAGGLYPYAPEGANVPGVGEIRAVEIRGEISRGMLCSAKELGLGDDHSGLMELSGVAGLRPGTPLLEVLEVEDHRLDVEVSPNRGDLLSHVGVAREVAPGGVAGVRLPPIPEAPEVSLRLMKGEHEVEAGGATVRIQDPELCSRYVGAVLRGVSIGPSPAWLQARLRAAGSRPINNVVDATNYVLLELGQPLHAFDLDRLHDRTLVVRRAAPDETRFTTLDGEERTIDESMLMICDARRPVAVAGVMGGLESEVDEATTDVLLECAMFEPASIRATRRALGLSTDASYRFERGVDPAGMERAVLRAAEVILATAGGSAEEEAPDCDPRPWRKPAVDLRLARVEQVLGVPFAVEEVESLLEPLGFAVVAGPDEGGDDRVLRVRVPGWRSYDVTREIDLVEEIARTHGYDAFPEELGAYRPGTVPDHPLFHLEDRLRTLLVGRGLLEAQTPAFVHASEGDVRVANPVSRQEDHLRRELLPGLVRRVEYNWSRGSADVRLFELGTAFAAAGPGEPPGEETRLATVLTGRRAPVHWSSPDHGVDLWDLRDLAEQVHAAVWPGGRIEPDEVSTRGVTQGYRLLDGNGRSVGRAGGIAPDQVDAPAWAGPLWGLELSLPAEPRPQPDPTFEPLPPFPGVERDLALVVPDDVPAFRVGEALRASGGEHLASVRLFDLYRGAGVAAESRSLAYRMRFQSRERTLTDEDVDRATDAIVHHLREALGVEPRI